MLIPSIYAKHESLLRRPQKRGKRCRSALWRLVAKGLPDTRSDKLISIIQAKFRAIHLDSGQLPLGFGVTVVVVCLVTSMPTVLLLGE